MKLTSFAILIALVFSCHAVVAAPSLVGEWVNEGKTNKLVMLVKADGTWKSIYTEDGHKDALTKQGKYSIKDDIVSFVYKTKYYDLPVQYPQLYSGTAKDKMQLKNGNLNYLGVTIYFKSNDGKTSGVINRKPS